jgi:hypothetical protein
MPEKRPSDYRAQWDALQQESAALAAQGKAQRGLRPGNPKVEEQEARLAALDVSKDAIAHAVWETTASDLADVLLLAEIVWDFHWGLAGVATFPALPPDIDDRPQAEVAVAYLLRGLVDAGQAHAGAEGGTTP